MGGGGIPPAPGGAPAGGGVGPAGGGGNPPAPALGGVGPTGGGIPAPQPQPQPQPTPAGGNKATKPAPQPQPAGGNNAQPNTQHALGGQLNTTITVQGMLAALTNFGKTAINTLTQNQPPVAAPTANPPKAVDPNAYDPALGPIYRYNGREYNFQAGIPITNKNDPDYAQVTKAFNEYLQHPQTIAARAEEEKNITEAEAARNAAAKLLEQEEAAKIAAQKEVERLAEEARLAAETQKLREQEALAKLQQEKKLEEERKEAERKAAEAEKLEQKRIANEEAQRLRDEEDRIAEEKRQEEEIKEFEKQKEKALNEMVDNLTKTKEIYALWIDANKTRNQLKELNDKSDWLVAEIEELQQMKVKKDPLFDAQEFKEALDKYDAINKEIAEKEKRLEEKNMLRRAVFAQKFDEYAKINPDIAKYYKRAEIEADFMRVYNERIKNPAFRHLQRGLK